jgi:hypothetical protein
VIATAAKTEFRATACFSAFSSRLSSAWVMIQCVQFRKDLARLLRGIL